MPTQSFDSYSLNGSYAWNQFCPNCGKPYLYVGDNGENIVCKCKPIDQNMPIKPYDTYHYDFNKVYAGKIAGIPIYVNSEKDRIELVEIIKKTFPDQYFYKLEE